MHLKKKRKLFVLYSIPINLVNRFNLCKRKYLVSYSIPLSCMVVLLLGFSVMINPSSTFKTNAIEVNEELNQELSGERDETVAEEADTTSAEGTNIIPRETTVPSITFEIGGAGQNEVIETGVDEVAYRRHTVNVSINDAEDYYLMISGQPTLTMSGSNAPLAGITDSNVTGANIPAGQWGYGWDYTGTKSDDEMIYTAVPLANTKIEIPALNDNAVNFAGKLNFAAKFPDNATLGSYTSNVALTLIVTPKANTGSATWRDEAGNLTTYDAGTSTMQGISGVSHGMDGGFCLGNNKIKEGWTVDLRDNRGTDPVTYTIIKIGGYCWMGENLAIGGPITLTPQDSDISSNWTLPPESESSWDKNNDTIQIRIGSSELSGWKKGYGNYYSWPAATAGTGRTSLTSGNATSSICPLGWKLPLNSGNGSYVSLANAYTSSWLDNLSINGTSNMSGYRLGLNSENVFRSANFWPAAGYINNSGATLDTPGAYGYYWSRTSYKNTDLRTSYSHGMFFEASRFMASSMYNRWTGLPVRCVADY